MKRRLILILAILVCCLAPFLYQHYSPDQWYGSFRIGDNTVVEFISVGNELFCDKNSDGIPQHNELVTNGEIDILSDGGEQFFLTAIATLFVPEACSSTSPQLLDVNFQHSARANVWQRGSVAMSLNRNDADTCHLMGPLSFLPLPPDFELAAGESNEIQISIGTICNNGSPATVALLCTSQVDDRNKYSFDDSERPHLKIWYGGELSNPEEMVVDGFC